MRCLKQPSQLRWWRYHYIDDSMQLPRHPWHGFFVVPLGSTMNGVSKLDKRGMVLHDLFSRDSYQYQYQYHTKPGWDLNHSGENGHLCLNKKKNTCLNPSNFLPKVLTDSPVVASTSPGWIKFSQTKPSPEALKNLLHNQGGWSFRCLKDSQRITAYRGARHPFWLFYLRWKDLSVVLPQTNTVIMIYHHEISLNVYINVVYFQHNMYNHHIYFQKLVPTQLYRCVFF